MRGRDHHGAPVGRVAQAESRPALQGAGDLAARGERVVGDGVVEIFVRARDQPTEHAARESLFGLAPFAPQAAGEREHAQVARHHPDARGGPLHALQDLGDLLCFAPPGGLFAVDDQRGPGALVGRLAALGGKAPQLFLGLAPHVGVARRRCAHELRAIMEGGGDGARRGEQRLLLAFEQKPLHLAHVVVTRPGQRKEHQRHQRELGAKAEIEVLHAFQR